MTDGTPLETLEETPEGAPLAAATAPGKIILLGEHAVVHGAPAIAAPLDAVGATATVWPADHPLLIRSQPPGRDPGEQITVQLAEAPSDDPLATAVLAALNHAGSDPSAPPDWLVEITSTVPLGAGLGSSASVAVAVVEAVAMASGTEPDRETVAKLAYEAEACTHGSPSGIDNTVVALGRPIRFCDGDVELLDVAAPLTLVVGDTGVQGLTADVVAGVADRREQRPSTYDSWFGDIGRYVDQAARAIAHGELVRLGWLMNSNHLVLQAMRVTTSELDALVAGARLAGALGAKMSGAGGGGVAVALVTPDTADDVADAMRLGGAVRTWRSHVPASES